MSNSYYDPNYEHGHPSATEIYAYALVTACGGQAEEIGRSVNPELAKHMTNCKDCRAKLQAQINAVNERRNQQARNN